ncbi:O-antigen translocase [Flavobacterium sp.]|jgi:PST family polysaccharide transporter|uniref:O-antigen translocase n=1 Tax=Flavobacterium sp. TaxID=239 RepID=UPI002A814541|nr:O-antigen translocase [Flavobacterium sp.]
MKSVFKNVVQSQLVKVSTFTSVSTIIKIISSFISAKFLAVFTGPAGIAMLGQLTNFITILIQVSTAATGTGVVKLTGEYRKDEAQLKRVLSTSFTINLFFSIFIGILLILFYPIISEFIFIDAKYGWLVVFIAFCTPLIAINNFILSALNGLQFFKKYVYVNIWASIISLFLTILLVVFYKIEGALLAYVLTQSTIFFVSLFHSKVIKWKQNVLLSIDKVTLKELSHFSLYVIISAFCFPFIQILVRTLLTETLSITIAGIWEGVNRVSSMYLLLISSAIGVYFFPKLSSLKTKEEISYELIFANKIFISGTVFLGAILLLLKKWLIPLALSNEFLPINEVLYIQVIGDVFSISKMLLLMVLLSRGKTSILIFAEIIFSALYCVLNYYFINNYTSLSVILWAYPIYTFSYWLFLLFWYKTKFKNI